MANERDRFGERLREKEQAEEKLWATRGDRELLARLKKEVEDRIAKDQRERRKPRAFNRILCAIDFGPNSLRALDLARQIASENEAELFVLNVCQTVPVPLSGSLTGTPDAEETARKQLAEVGKKHLVGIQHQLIVMAGDPVARIAEVQTALQIDLIVTGTHGRKGVPRFFLGSVADKIIRQATCPVLTMRTE